MLLSSLIFSFIRARLHEFERYGKDSEQLQQQELNMLIKSATQTEMGRRYHFQEIKTYTQFAQRVPIHSYDELKGDIQRMMHGEANILWPGMPKWFAKSSGTTCDKSKYIPISQESLQKCHFRAAIDVLALYSEINPQSDLFSGKQLVLGGSNKIINRTNSIRVGDLSSILLQNAPEITLAIRTPELKTMLMDEWESKLEAIIKETQTANVRSLSGVPSWMMVMIKRMLEVTGKKDLTEVWPNLEVFFHGGISFSPYRELYKTVIPSPQMHYMETFNASEGFFGIQNTLSESAMLLLVDIGIFYEFIPMNQLDQPGAQAIPLWEVRNGVNYAMVITTNGGLWRYLIGDTICFHSTHPYKFTITGRTKNYINAFGEELMIHNADHAIERTCLQTGAVVKEYTVAPIYLTSRQQGKHQWMIEFEKPPASISQFTELLDHHLQEQNSDYEAKRYKSITLDQPEVIVARKNLFHDWLQSEGKLGGQNKVPRLSNERKTIEKLININDPL